MNNRRIQNIIYSLKKEYSNTIKLQWRISSSVDRTTGDKTVQYGCIQINKAIILTEALKRQFRNVFSRKNEEFKYGGYVDLGTKAFIIDSSDLNGTIPKIDYWIVCSGIRYDINNIVFYPDMSAFVITAAESNGNPKYEQFNLIINDRLSSTMSDTVEATQNV